MRKLWRSKLVDLWQDVKLLVRRTFHSVNWRSVRRRIRLWLVPVATATYWIARTFWEFNFPQM
ncbi:hypothetical protein ACFVZH_39695 [Streptomyces sp. NPDC059534]|uniref:hypothetical protein n=1 Tax=Streptomyces sp. NPDC059534 TaxID=3346859 RepID=UPI0036AFD098